MASFSLLLGPARNLHAAATRLQEAATANQKFRGAGGDCPPGLINACRVLDRCAKHAAEVLADVVNQLEEGLFRVVFVGRIKTGKSTIINFFIGHRLQPSSVQPQTAFPVAFVHGSNLRVEGLNAAAVTPKQIEAALGDANKLAREGNARAAYAERRVTVEVPMEAMRGLPPHGGRLALNDAAGFGEQGAEALQRASAWALDRANFVVHVADYTKMNEAEDIAILQQLQRERPELFERRAVLVLLNKADEYKSGEKSVTPEQAPGFYRKSLAAAGVALPAESVLAVRGLDGLRARLRQLGRSNEEQDAELFQEAFGRLWAAQTAEALDSEAADILQQSGMVEAERRVQTLYEQHGPQLASSSFAQMAALAAALEKAANELATVQAAVRVEADERRGASDAARAAVREAREGAEGGTHVLDFTASDFVASFWRAGGAALARLDAVGRATRALLSGSEPERAAARAALGDPALVARFDAAAADADRVGGGESGLRGEALERQVELWAAARAYLTSEVDSGAARTGAGLRQGLAARLPQLNDPLGALAARAGTPAPPLAAAAGQCAEAEAAFVSAARAAAAAAAAAAVPAAAPTVAAAVREWTQVRKEWSVRMVPQSYEGEEEYVDNESRTRTVDVQEPYESTRTERRTRQVVVPAGSDDGGVSPVGAVATAAATAVNPIIGGILAVGTFFGGGGHQSYEVRDQAYEETVPCVLLRTVQKQESYVEPVAKKRSVTKVREVEERYEKAVEETVAAYSVDRHALAAAAAPSVAAALAAAGRALETATGAPAVHAAAHEAAAGVVRPALAALEASAAARAEEDGRVCAAAATDGVELAAAAALLAEAATALHAQQF